MRPSTADLRDVCRLLGGLTLAGARTELLRQLRQESVPAALGEAVGGELGNALVAMQRALDEEALEPLAAEYTRLMVANADRGARSPLPVPPWEDCYVGGERKIFGARSQAARRAYAAVALGFDGMASQPADHVGLELCFVAALLDQEERGERDDSGRAAFVDGHLRSFSPAIGKALAACSRSAFWRETGRAIASIPGALSAEAHCNTEVSSHHSSAQR